MWRIPVLLFALLAVLLPANVMAFGECVSVGGLPDHRCTPGYRDLDVGFWNIQQTICQPGYNGSVVIPPSAETMLWQYISPMYGIRWWSSPDPRPFYELDRLIPVNLGGHSYAPKNLWPQLLMGPYNAMQKDMVENEANRRVCNRTLGLYNAQTRIAANWIQFGHDLGVLP